jgi:hypothetical protein
MTFEEDIWLANFLSARQIFWYKFNYRVNWIFVVE